MSEKHTEAEKRRAKMLLKELTKDKPSMKHMIVLNNISREKGFSCWNSYRAYLMALKDDVE